jgi:hypothetical protein
MRGWLIYRCRYPLSYGIERRRPMCQSLHSRTADVRCRTCLARLPYWIGGLSSIVKGGMSPTKSIVAAGLPGSKKTATAEGNFIFLVSQNKTRGIHIFDGPFDRRRKAQLGTGTEPFGANMQRIGTRYLVQQSILTSLISSDHRNYVHSTQQIAEISDFQLNERSSPVKGTTSKVNKEEYRSPNLAPHEFTMAKGSVRAQTPEISISYFGVYTIKLKEIDFSLLIITSARFS